MIDLTKYKIGTSFDYDTLKEIRDHPDHTYLEVGEDFIIGRQFMYIIDERDNTLSFVFNAYSNTSWWKLIWKG